MQKFERAARPLGVTLIAFACWLCAAVLVPIGLASSVDLLRSQGVAALPLLLGAMWLLLGGALAGIGAGLWRLRRGTYQLVVALASLAILGNLVTGYERGELRWASLVVAGATLLYLLRLQVREVFR